jgi:hypothetical protein
MTDSSSFVTRWVDQLKADLVRDKRKTAVLLTLAVVALFVGMRAGIKTLSSDAAEPRPADENLAADPGDESSEPPIRTDPAEDSKAAAARERYLAGLDRDIRRDIFKPNTELLPSRSRAADNRMEVRVQPREHPIYKRLSEWLKNSRTTERERSARLEAVRAQARGLKLQSVMLGPSSTALINGRVLKKGEWISGFQVQSIASDRCVVTRDGVEVTLYLSNQPERG